MNYEEFFRQATGLPHDPYPYQDRLAVGDPFPELLDVPTGLGKTAAVVLAWIWRRRFEDRFKAKTPRRLVYCLPMRVLVEQTYENAVGWLDRLGLLAGVAEWYPAERRRLQTYQAQPDANDLHSNGWARQQGVDGPPIAVHLLMGGADRTDWVTWPERDAILIGTQDMLVSRALNRGYAAGRARWPMDFGLLNNDCLWVFDEVQLMSTGLATSLQLDAWRRTLRLRRKDGFHEATEHPVARLCPSLWISATMTRHWLDSAVDWQLHAQNAWDKGRHCLTDADYRQDMVKQLFNNKKAVAEKPAAILAKPRTQDGRVDNTDATAKSREYIDYLAKAVAKGKSNTGLTLVILNTVDRAILLYDALRRKPNDIEIHIIHSRFRPMEREEWKEIFANENSKPRIIISTQVVEAGVDITANVLFTELAPWASLVQRFGRCARRANETGTVYWMDVAAHESTALPYSDSELSEAKDHLKTMTDAGLKSMRVSKEHLDQPQNAVRAAKLFPYDPRFVPRDKDLFDLFDTTPDLTGADVDISRYIRDGPELDVQVFWRDIGKDQEPIKQDRPDRRELCPVAFYRFRQQVRNLIKYGRIWRRNYLKGWEPLSADDSELVYPGQVFLLEQTCGGYDERVGWTGGPEDRNFDLLILDAQRFGLAGSLDENDSSEDGEPLSALPGWVKLSDHSRHVSAQMHEIGSKLLPDYEHDLPLAKLAARWHDRGKAHESFEANFKPGVLEEAKSGQLQGEPAAKAPNGEVPGQSGRDESRNAWRRDKPRSAREGDKRRPGFRHELASALAILETLRHSRPDHAAFAWPEGLDKEDFGGEAEGDDRARESGLAAEELAALSRDDFDLLLYLVAAHHGKVRMSLRSSPDDSRIDVPDPCPPEKRQARGIRDCDRLPACKMPDSHGNNIEVPEVLLNLDSMELGLSCRYGPSWRDRMQNLLERLGPFRLAYLEALLRIADWRASRQEEKDGLEGSKESSDNRGHELDSGRPQVAPALTGGAAAHPARPPATEGGAEHGVRGRAGEPADAGGGTRPPHAATRYLSTTLGVLSYAELAPHLATRVATLHKSIADGEFDSCALDEDLLRELHGRICGDLTPDIAGRWRAKNVTVGDHEPPAYPYVAQRIREYTLDLRARIDSLPAEPNDLWLETLAFAEGRLLSIHPFADFNGRVTRVFIDVLTRVLGLPDVDPTPDPGTPTDRYLRAVRAADRNDWRPLMDIWRERFEEEGTE